MQWPDITIIFHRKISHFTFLHSMDFVWLRRQGVKERPSQSTPDRSAFHYDNTAPRNTLFKRTGWHNVQTLAPPHLPSLRASKMKHLFQDKNSDYSLTMAHSSHIDGQKWKTWVGMEEPLSEQLGVQATQFFPGENTWLAAFQLRLHATSLLKIRCSLSPHIKAGSS